MLPFQNNLLELLPPIQREVFIEIWILRNFCCEANSADNGFFSKLSEMSSRQITKRIVSCMGRSWTLIRWRVFKRVVGADGRVANIRLSSGNLHAGSRSWWDITVLTWHGSGHRPASPAVNTVDYRSCIPGSETLTPAVTEALPKSLQLLRWE